MSKKYVVYCLETTDGRRYIGITSTSLRERWNNGNGYRAFPELWEMIVKHGWESVKKTVLGSELSIDEASEMEQKYIALYSTTDPTKGYNRELGGIGSLKSVSFTTREKMSSSKIGEKNPNYGIHFSEDRKSKLAASNRGQKRSRETCRRIGEAKKKPVSQYTLDGKLVGTWASGKEAALATGIGAAHISKVCKNEQKTAGGFLWKFD